MEVKKPNKSLLFYAFVVMIILILLNALVIPKISERSVTETTYDEFLALLDAKYVKQAKSSSQNKIMFLLDHTGPVSQLQFVSGKP